METVKCPECGADVEVREWKTVLGRRFAITEECQNCSRMKDTFAEEQRIQKAQDLARETNLQKKYNSITFKGIEEMGHPSVSYKKAFDACYKYCSVIDKALEKGWGIYLYGDTGRGKTTIAAAMINELTSNGISCYINNISNLKNILFKNKAFIYDLIKVDVLFLDDFGTEVYTKGNETDTWTNERVYEIINARYERQKPIIFTSNLNPGELVYKGLLPKTADRVSGMSTRKIKIETAKSLRL